MLTPIYGTQRYKLRVAGGTALQANPMSGQIVAVTADADTHKIQFHYWTTSTSSIDIAVPSARTLQFVMPSADVDLAVQLKD